VTFYRRRGDNRRLTITGSKCGLQQQASDALSGARIAGDIPLPMTMVFAMMVMVSIRPMILSFVMINIKKPEPAQIRVVAVVAAPIPAMKIIMSPQPPGIMMAVPDIVDPAVAAIDSSMTPVC